MGRATSLDESRTPPVCKDDIIDLLIHDVGVKGDGLGYMNGFVIFVKNGKPGEKVKVRIDKVFASFAKASIIG